MASITQYDVEATIRKVKGTGMVNKILQLICVGEGLTKYGVKAELQQKIIDSIQRHAKNGDANKFYRLKAMIDDPTSIEESASPYRAMAGSSSSPAVNPPATPFSGPSKSNHLSAVAAHNQGGGPAATYRIIGHPRIEFKSSPYYAIEEQLGAPTQCDIMTHHRHTVKVPLRPIDYPILTRVQTDPNLKVMVFCAAEGGGRQDIAFPHQSEIKVNGGEVKANLRGLKNKPGSTRPVDITKELRLNIPAYSNNVEMTYALTSKKFYLVLYVVRSIPVTDLVKKLENGKRITEKSVVDDMLNKARDADIVTTASVLSLKCPLSTLRISLPVRSIACRHNQCFDATSYLQLQEQGPTWLCPICNNPAPFDSLAVDEYVNSILKGTSRSVDQVTIQPDAKWELNNRKEQPASNSRSNGVASDSDDDIVEITKSGNSVRMGAPAYKPALGGLSQSRESSGTPKNPGSTSSKRPISAVIDLTSSGDEDEEPIRAPKRQLNASTNTNGFSSLPNPPFSLPARPPNAFPPRP
ncbi:PINIT domain-containing protein [Hyaloscypha finlandica]|nr:PINIT domain-containing protein [Hyaloscypha finlandica]